VKTRLHLMMATAMLTASMGSIAKQEVIKPILPNEKPIPGSTEAELWYGMDQAEKEIKVSPYVIRDPALNAYVQEVACKVTGDYCKNMRVYIIDAPAFNASMSPNGVMLVFSGALLRMQDEAELALVMSHEFGHFKQRHSLATWNKAKRTTAFLATFGVLTYAGGVGIVGGVAQLVGFANFSQFSRDKEREADQIGFNNASELGYDPQAGVRIWSRMQREEKANKQAKYNPVFASHPRTSERLEDIATAANAFGKGHYQTYQDNYQKVMHPFLQKWLDGELSKRMYDPSIQVVTDLKASSNKENLGIYNFYLAEAYRRRNKNDDMTVAAKLYAEAITYPQTPAAAWREQGLILRKDNNFPEAIKYLNLYLQKNPKAEDLSFIKNYITDMENKK
jgi:beta-barrel assembly-enhancing protease